MARTHKSKAKCVFQRRQVMAEGRTVEGVIWKVPAPVPPSIHEYKYRLAYLVDGARVLGFDNERGKGDHCHIGGEEMPYVFRGVEQLAEDFIQAIEQRRKP